MSKHAKPSHSLHTSGAPFATSPGHIAISPEAHVVLPSHASAWSAATIVYVVIALLMLVAFYWAASKPKNNDPIDNALLKTFAFGFYLVVGLVLVMLFSHNKSTMYAWIVVLVSLIPAVVVLFWGMHHYQIADDKEQS